MSFIVFATKKRVSFHVINEKLCRLCLFSVESNVLVVEDYNLQSSSPFC